MSTVETTTLSGDTDNSKNHPNSLQKMALSSSVIYSECAHCLFIQNVHTVYSEYAHYVLNVHINNLF